MMRNTLIIGKIVIEALEKGNLDLKKYVGISTGTRSVMVSTNRGAVMTAIEEATNAVHSPFHNHCLNRSISQSSTLRDTVVTMKSTIFCSHHPVNDMLFMTF